MRKRKWISTGVKVLPKHWNNNKKVIGRMDAIDLNMAIENVESSILTFVRKLMIDKLPFTWQGLELAMEKEKMANSFVHFVEELVEKRKDIQNTTRRNHRKFYKALKEFGRIQEFDDLKKTNIVLYDEWLRNRRDYTQTTIASYHKYLKIYINEAIRQEYISINPYNGMKIDQGKPKTRKYLTSEELEKIESAVLPNKSFEKIRDLFIFQAYTGLAYADLKKFDFGKVEERRGRLVIHDVRQKTGEDFYIVLLPKVVHILEKYDFKLPLMTCEQYNLRLKVVAGAAGIEKNLTSHMGRHTYATMCLNSGVKMEVLAKMLGHSDIKTTQLYGKIVDSTVEDAYRVLEQTDSVKRLVYYLTDALQAVESLLRRI